MKRLLLIGLLMLLIVAAVGCQGYQTSDERIAALEQAVVVSQQALADSDTNIAQLQEVIAKSRVYLTDSSLDSETKAKIESILNQAQTQLTAAIAKKADIQASLNQFQQQITDIKTNNEGIGAELQIYGEGLQHIGENVPAPVGPWIGLAGTVLALAGSVIIGWKKSKQAQQNHTISQSLVSSVDVLLAGMSEVEAAAAKAKLIKQQQDDGTRTAIKTILNGA